MIVELGCLPDTDRRERRRHTARAPHCSARQWTTAVAHTISSTSSSSKECHELPSPPLPPFCPLPPFSPSDLCTTHRHKSVPSRLPMLGPFDPLDSEAISVSLQLLQSLYLGHLDWKVTVRCQELIPVNQVRQAGCSWLDTLIPSWRTASPGFLLTDNILHSFTLSKTFTGQSIVLILDCFS